MTFLVILGWILISIVVLFLLVLAFIGGFFVWYMFVREGAEGPQIFKESWNRRD